MDRVGGARAFPVSVKRVAVRAGRVLLLMNERAEWELPGGMPDGYKRSVMTWFGMLAGSGAGTAAPLPSENSGCG